MVNYEKAAYSSCHGLRYHLEGPCSHYFVLQQGGGRTRRGMTKRQTTAHHRKPPQTTTNYRKPPHITANHHKSPPEFGTIGSVTRDDAGKPPQTTANHCKPPPEYEGKKESNCPFFLVEPGQSTQAYIAIHAVCTIFLFICKQLFYIKKALARGQLLRLRMCVWRHLLNIPGANSI